MSFKKLINAVLPSVPRTGDRQTLQFLSALKQSIDEIRNNIVVSDQGIVSKVGTAAANDQIVAVSATNVENADPDALVTPHQPTNLTATGLFSSIALSWDYTGPGVGKFQIFRITLNSLPQTDSQGNDIDPSYTLSDGVVIDETQITSYSDAAVEHGKTYVYFIRGVSSGGLEGPNSGVAYSYLARDPLSQIAQAQDSVTNSSLNTFLQTDLNDYVTDTELSSNLSNYAQTSSIAGIVNGLPFNSTITQLQNDVTLQETLLGESYTLKVSDADTGTVAGFGLATSSGTSDFQVLADRFSITGQSLVMGTRYHQTASPVKPRVFSMPSSVVQSGVLYAPTLELNVFMISGAPYLEVVLRWYTNLDTAFAANFKLNMWGLFGANGSLGWAIAADLGDNYASFDASSLSIGLNPYDSSSARFSHRHKWYQLAPSSSGITQTNLDEVQQMRFELWDVSSVTTPFVVQNNQVFIDSAVIGTASISSAQIASLDAGKINATNLSSIRADLGTVTAGKMQSTDGDFIIDLSNKLISITV